MILNSLKSIIRRRYNICFSKSGDDIQLMKLINKTSPGTYVDIGCWDPIKASNTYYFSLRGWKGLCIDPNPELKQLYEKFRPKDYFINAGIGASKTNLDYYFLEESSMNTMSLDFIKKHDLENKIIRKTKIPVYTLKEILDKYLIETDRLYFFDVDAEGYDLEILKTNDWEIYRPKIVVIEGDISLKSDVKSEIVKYSESKNYKLIGKTIINGDFGNLFLVSN